MISGLHPCDDTVTDVHVRAVVPEVGIVEQTDLLPCIDLDGQ